MFSGSATGSGFVFRQVLWSLLPAVLGKWHIAFELPIDLLDLWHRIGVNCGELVSDFRGVPKSHVDTWHSHKYWFLLCNLQWRLQNWGHRNLMYSNCSAMCKRIWFKVMHFNTALYTCQNDFPYSYSPGFKWQNIKTHLELTWLKAFLW